MQKLFADEVSNLNRLIICYLCSANCEADNKDESKQPCHSILLHP